MRVLLAGSTGAIGREAVAGHELVKPARAEGTEWEWWFLRWADRSRSANQSGGRMR